MTKNNLEQFALDYNSKALGNSLVVNTDCLEWLRRVPEASIHGVVTDPLMASKNISAINSKSVKMDAAVSGVYRPLLMGVNVRLCRFTALSPKELDVLRCFFIEWSRLIVRVLKPGGHIIIASNTYLSQLMFAALVEGGLEFRGEIIRLVRTLRGGDKPKNAEDEFPFVSTLPRGCYEPWGLLRKPMPAKMRVSDCLKIYGTGGLRRLADGNPFSDVISSERTPKRERIIANHPSLKPQSFLRQMVYAVLPMGEGIILDPFMGSGSTVAAAESVGLACIGVEVHEPYYTMSLESIPKLASLKTNDPVLRQLTPTLL